MSDSISKGRPQPLPATVADLMAHRNKIAPPNLNDNVERLYLELYTDKDFQRLLDAVYSEDAKEGSLYADDLLAAKMIREHAENGGNDPYVAGKKLATIVRSLHTVLARYDLTRKARAAKVGSVSVPDAA